MEKSLEKETVADVRQDALHEEQAAKRKKTYRKPELVKHDQLHGVGLGS